MLDSQTYHYGTPIREVARRERWARIRSVRWPGWRAIGLNVAALAVGLALELACYGLGETIWHVLTLPLRMLLGG